MSNKIQNEDIKSESELIADGGAKAQLPNDDKIYITANSLNKTLKEAIINGDLSGGGSTAEYALITDERSNGVASGTFTAGSYVTHQLTTLYGGSGFCTLDTGLDRFALQPGTYAIIGYSEAFGVDEHKAKIVNVSDSTDIALGNSAFAYSTSLVQNASKFKNNSFTISSAKSFELQCRCGTTRASNGFGAACAFGDNEKGAEILVIKLA